VQSPPAASHAKQHLTLLEACAGQHHAAAVALCAQLSTCTPAQEALAFAAADADGWCPLLCAAGNGWADVVAACLGAQAGGSPHAARRPSTGNTGELRGREC
jgi:hypothetical protein